MNGPEWEEWRPPFAKHVLGRYTPREHDPETGIVDQMYSIQCETCHQSFGPVKCTTGAVREHITRFAIQHTHRNPLT
jgi:hypothetical protein